MPQNLISVKNYLGKFYQELHDSIAANSKYTNLDINLFFEQRFFIQNNKVQLIVDPQLTGLAVHISGNEIRISQDLYDNQNVEITNSIDDISKLSISKTLFSTKTFSSIAYLICKNNTLFKIIGDIDQPINVTFKSDYETFYNSVLLFLINSGVSVNIIETVESHCALNSVVNYICSPYSKLSLSTFYSNDKSAVSFVYRNVIASVSASYSHSLYGKGSSNVIDENRIVFESDCNISLKGALDTKNSRFNSILELMSVGDDNNISIDFRSITEDKSRVAIVPIIDVIGVSKISLAIKNMEINDSSFTINNLIKCSDEKFIFNLIENNQINQDKLGSLLADGLSEHDAINKIVNHWFSPLLPDDSYSMKNKFLR